MRDYMPSESDGLPALIPWPLSVERAEGSFCFSRDTTLVADKPSVSTARHLAACLQPACGFDLAPDSRAGDTNSAIVLGEDPNLREWGPEGYRVDVTPTRVSLTASTQAGLFYAVQTLRQLLPPQVFSPRPVDGVEWRIPCVTIRDRPRFGWRGLMLDTGHDFQREPFIRRFIDLMALHKFNVLHWHITDLGTFPLEIRGYPKLQDPATLGTRQRGEPPRGVKPGRYTQDEARALVRYAAERHITVVPEIDMPGHSTPALTAYPELDCPVPHKTWEWDRWEYCLGNERTYAFLEQVLDQVLEIFPSRFIHIGGDECPADHWKKCPVCQAKIKAANLRDEEGLRAYFIKRIESFLAARGRRMIGWDDIFKCGLAPGSAVMPWRAEVQETVPAIQAGHEVVSALSTHLYFDYPEKRTPLEKVYAFEPVPAGLTPEQAVHLLGAQAQMWTDHHPTEPEIERLVYPRACAVSEIVWSPAGARDYSRFVARLAVHAQRLAALGIDVKEGGVKT
jgi:hexosaminidase